MFTSRAEYRTLLRQDNADLRLTEKSYRIGLASQHRMDKVVAKKENIQKINTLIENITVELSEVNELLSQQKSALLTQKQKLSQLILRPAVYIKDLRRFVPKLDQKLNGFDEETIEQAEIQIKYDIYLQKEKDFVQKMSQLEEQIIPDNFNYDKIFSLSNEARQKFKKIQPRTLGQASRISGVNPSDVQILMVFMGR